MSLNSATVSIPEIAGLARCRKPFAAVMFDDRILLHNPGDSHSGTCDDDRRSISDFTICTFDKTVIRFSDLRIAAEDLTASRMQPSTTRPDYDRSVSRTVAELQCTGSGKTVISRVIDGHTSQSLEDILQALMLSFSGTCRFVFYTPATGLWIGASPELLIHNCPSHGRLSTMALAGTRDISCAASGWDEKNREEHRMVVDFIVGTLRAAGLNPQTAPASDLRYGNILHLFTPITSDPAPDPHALLAQLSPTPALGGYPVAEAISRIRRVEGHNRQCYGGYISFDMTGGDNITYVVLRCARIMLPEDPATGSIRYNVYAGGGITGSSVVEDEWAETSAKASRLLEILNNASNVLSRIQTTLNPS